MQTVNMECVNLVSNQGYFILALLILSGLGGVGFHALWSGRLALVDFNKSDLSNKSNLKRLFIPALIVALICMIIPIVFIIANTDFSKCLEAPDLGSSLNIILTFILPVQGTGIILSTLVCALIGFIWYWIFGAIVYFITRGKGRA